MDRTGDTPVIARGAARSYGDASFGPGLTLDMRRLDHVTAFDAASGVMTCEAGVLLSDVIRLWTPRGWFPPVTPGTKFVTIGGMIASDVHGKNHHLAGSFGDHVISFRLALGDGSVATCSRTENVDLFEATCGGMGLTGVILEATFRMIPVRSARIMQETQRAPNLAAAMDLFEAGSERTYSVAWIDCLATGAELGRSAVIFGDHASPDDFDSDARSAPFSRRTPNKRRIPLDFPGFALNRASVSAFNKLYYKRQAPGRRLVDLEPYFYPLDAIQDWNRIYGQRGFVQYQCVLPLATSRDGLAALLTEIARAGDPSFLAVLKRLGRESFGLLSFPLEGYTLALDFPATDRTFGLLDRLDDITLEAGGRLYLTKDARMRRAMLEASYPRLDRFRAVREQYGFTTRFRSALSDRLGL
ncbi:oxidoreductase [Alsobacter metallidurans]|uniref:Oxidoreductase n=1 Tax=Alsobacter metallidurans TaxID=340221 RepID=A0A917I6F4_9HYPH|nr:FAD-binding oxidoreductase [Alsobacter metallidurans]GGH17341.1 oxidoreductase [Alsobacter metallidurans]